MMGIAVSETCWTYKKYNKIISDIYLVLILQLSQKFTWRFKPSELLYMDQVEEDLKRMKIIGWRAKVENRQEWNRIVEQAKTHPGLYSQ